MASWLFCGSLILFLYEPVSSVEFEPARLHLGSVKAGQVFDRTVQVRNCGSETLTVREFKTSCGCVVSRLEPPVLLPGTSGRLFLQINTLSARPGLQGWRLMMFGERGSQPCEIEYIIAAEVEQELILSPAAITLIGGRRATQHVLTLTDRRPRPLEVLRIETSSARIVAGSPPKLSGTPATGTLHISVTEGFPEGRHYENVILYTNDADYPQLRIPITITRKPISR